MSQNTSDFITDRGQLVTTRHAVVLDTDIGDDIDDALALALILQSPEIELKGITTVFGDTQQRARLAAYLLTIFKQQDIPVAAGSPTPLQIRHHPSGVPQAAVVPEHMLFPTLNRLSAPELIARIARAHPGQLTLLCIGPLTNIATTIMKYSLASKAIRNIVLMGGSSGFPVPEWNVRSDVRAAQIVLASGIPITMIGFNVTWCCHLRARDLALLASSTSQPGQLLNRLTTIWQQHRPHWQSHYPYLHDPLTIAALCIPDVFRFSTMKVKVFTRGPLQGFMVPHLNDGQEVSAATGVNIHAAREWIMQRLLAPAPSGKQARDPDHEVSQ